MGQREGAPRDPCDFPGVTQNHGLPMSTASLFFKHYKKTGLTKRVPRFYFERITTRIVLGVMQEIRFAPEHQRRNNPLHSIDEVVREQKGVSALIRTRKSALPIISYRDIPSENSAAVDLQSSIP